MTTYRLERAEPQLFRAFYRAHGRIYCLVNEGGHGRPKLTFYSCGHDGEPRRALGFVPDEHEFDVYVEP
jgi:hypothetical protein